MTGMLYKAIGNLKDPDRQARAYAMANRRCQLLLTLHDLLRAANRKPVLSDITISGDAPLTIPAEGEPELLRSAARALIPVLQQKINALTSSIEQLLAE